MLVKLFKHNYATSLVSVRAAAHQLRQDKHQDMRRKKQKLTSASWLRPVCSFLCVMSQTSCLDCYMSWRMPVCGLPYAFVSYLIPAWEVNSLSANEEISWFVDSKVHYRIYWSLSQSQMNPVHTHRIHRCPHVSADTSLLLVPVSYTIYTRTCVWCAFITWNHLHISASCIEITIQKFSFFNKKHKVACYRMYSSRNKNQQPISWMNSEMPPWAADGRSFY
jgi:hypothetical protein